MGKLQIIHTDGEDLVVIPRRDYEALLARAGDEPVGRDKRSALRRFISNSLAEVTLCRAP